MSKISLKSSSSGTATFTIESPATNTDRTLVLPDGSGALYNQSNILGTVSQSSGVPTGAIIERGSNANGAFVKYADGTMICFIGGQVAGGTTVIPLTYPAPFAITSNNRRVATRQIATIATFGQTVYDGSGDSTLAVTDNTGIIYQTTNNVSPHGQQCTIRILSGLQGTSARFSDFAVTASGRWY